MTQDFLQVRSLGLQFHVLRDAKGLYLIDSGFIGGLRSLRQALIRQGWENLPIVGIILTHGHLDHILNVSAIASETGAWIAAPRLDAAHYAGNPRYGGVNRITGWLEGIGRQVLGFRPFEPTRLLDDGDFLDVWHGLSVVHLPGHTAGHCGLYCERLRILFSGDLFASYQYATHFPPAVLNLDSQQVLQSAAKALALDVVGFVPNHADAASPEVHLERLKRLFLRQQILHRHTGLGPHE